MQLSTLTFSALCVAGALAQSIKTHVVRVGSLDAAKALTYSPSELTAEVGDMVQFQFAPKNHTVTQSTFDRPCEPSLLNSNITGINSGYIPVAADSQMTATYTIRINSTAPLWLYCAQARHCQSGMVMVINAPAANATRTLENYKALAAKAAANIPGDAVMGNSPNNGTSGGNNGTPNGGSGGNGGSGNGGNNNNGGSSTDNSANGGSQTTTAGGALNTGAAASVRVGQALLTTAIVAMGFAVLL